MADLLSPENLNRCERMLTAYSCIKSYTAGKLTGPNCMACSLGLEVIDEFRALRAEVERLWGMDSPLLIDAADAGRLLSLRQSTVTRLANRGLLPSVVLPTGERRYVAADLRDWALSHRQPAQEVTR